MFDIIGFLLIVIFTPIITVQGMKYYKVSLNKTIIVLTYLFLGLELFRFFYTAQFYQRAYMPADKVTFTFLTFSLLACLFATFNKNKLGCLSKTIFTFTALAPIIIALLYPHVYTNELDEYAVVKALYFVESGITLTIALMFLKEEISKVSMKSIIFSISFVAIYIFANVMRNIYWIPSMSFDLKWFLCMGLIILSTGLVYGITFFLAKKDLKKINE